MDCFLNKKGSSNLDPQKMRPIWALFILVNEFYSCFHGVNVYLALKILQIP